MNLGGKRDIFKFRIRKQISNFVLKISLPSLMWCEVNDLRPFIPWFKTCIHIFFRIDSHAVWVWLIIFFWLLRNSVDQFGTQILLQCRAFTFSASLALKKEPKHALFWNPLSRLPFLVVGHNFSLPPSFYPQFYIQLVYIPITYLTLPFAISYKISSFM